MFFLRMGSEIASRSKDATRGLLALLLGARTLLVTKGIATRSKDAIRLEAIAIHCF